MRRAKPDLRIILGGVLICAALAAAAGRPGVTGYPFVRNYDSREYRGHAQNFAIAKDARGLAYFGNFAGVLQFDGTVWRLIPTEKISKVNSLASDNEGRIYVGGREEFGMLRPDSSGDLRFVSLIPAGMKGVPAFQDVIETFCLGNEVFFITSGAVFTRNASKLSWWIPPSPILSAFLCEGKIYLQLKGSGLRIFDQGKLADVAGGEIFTDAVEIRAILEHTSGTRLIATGSRGLFLATAGGITPVKTEASAFLDRNLVTCGVKLGDGSYALGTTREGILILTPSLQIRQIIGREAGLQNSYIQALYPWNGNLLWAALNNGIALAETPSSFSVFNEHCGLNGSVNQVMRFRGELFVSTFQGLFVLDENARNFRPVPGIVSSCWTLMPFGDQMLAATSQGLFLAGSKSSRQVAQGFMLSLAAPPGELNYCYAGMADGLARAERRGNSFVLSRIPGTRDEIDDILCDGNGKVWCTSPGGVLLSYDPGSGKIAYYDTLDGLPGRSGNTLHLAGGKLVAATRSGLFSWDETADKFREWAPPFADTADGNQWYTHLTTDASGGIWAAMGDETRLRYFRNENGKLSRIMTPFLPVSTAVILEIYPEAEGICWFGTPDGLLRYDPSVPLDNAMPPSALIRRISAKEDSLVYLGEGDLPKSARLAVFQSDENDMRFDFSAPAFGALGEVMYQYRMDGFDQTWSDWTSQHYKEFTNLPKGDFLFSVRAMNAYGQTGGEAVYAFRILAPWYTKWYSIVFYILMASALVWGIVLYRNRKLLKEKKALEKMITDRTGEIVRQKEEIEKQSAELAGKNDELEKISTVVKAINSEINFSNLLQSLLEKTMIIKAVEKATALILDRDSGLYRYRASFGWDIRRLENMQLTLQQAEQRYLRDAEEIYEDIFVKKDFGNLNQDMPSLADYEIPRSMLVLVIRVDQKVEAFLILENMTRSLAFVAEDLSFVRNSKEHIISAFIKTRILEDLQSTLDHLKSTQDQLVQSQKLASLGELTAGIAHEIQNPLNFVTNFSSLSTDLAIELSEYVEEVKDSIPEKRREDIKELVEMIAGNVEKITEHGKRAASIVKGMLQHSRGKSAEFEQVELNNMVTEYMNLAYHGMRAKDKSFNTSLRTDLDPAVGKVLVIPQELSRVILNIVNNSCYAVDEKARQGIPGYVPEVVTSTRKVGNKVEIRIRDNGTGMPPHVIEKIFNPFFTTKPTGKGTGLGLSMSFDIVTQMHKGKLEVTSGEGEFTEFLITLPENRANQ
jgi:signal transduction histidine kinase